MKINIGDRIVSDDHCVIGTLTQVGEKLIVVSDFCSVEYEEYCADWEPQPMKYKL